MVSVEIRILSLYPAPLEALELLSKWFVLVCIGVFFFACLSKPPTCFHSQVQYQPPVSQHQHLRVYSLGFTSQSKFLFLCSPSPPHPSSLLIIFLPNISVQAGENEEDMMGEGVLRLLLQPWETREVAVVFTPSDHKPTTTLLIIRCPVGHRAHRFRTCCYYQALNKS